MQEVRAGPEASMSSQFIEVCADSHLKAENKILNTNVIIDSLSLSHSIISFLNGILKKYKNKLKEIKKYNCTSALVNGSKNNLNNK